MNAFLQTLRNLGPLRLAAIAVVGISLLGMLGFVTTRISSSPLALLYTELDATDSGAIVSKLDALKVPYQVDPNGSLIRVPSDQVGKIRMMMAADGLPKGGSIGYEIFDQKEGFGTTSFVQNINHLRALEGELARTISSMDPIKSARVNLVLPQRELFSHATQTATASIFLKMRNGAVLSREQVAAIQHLIAASVPQLQPNEVSIVDDRGNLLAKPSANADGSGIGGDDHDEMRQQYEQAQVHKIEDLLTQTLGFGKVRAQVSADLDYDRITTNSEIFDPDSQVVRSTQTTSEDSTNAEGSGSGGNPSVSGALPATPQQIGGGGAAGGSSNKNAKSEETTNYEINKTIRNQTRESGSVKRLSVAVVVDGAYKTEGEGKDAHQTYVPRTPDEMKQIEDLVRSAVNFDANRGDTLKVENMQFAQADVGKDPAGPSDMLMGIPRADLFHAAETIILALIGLLVVLLVVRPILKKILEGGGSMGGEQGLLAGGGNYAGGGYSGGGGMAQLSAPGGGGAPMMLAGGRDLDADTAAAESELERMVDVSRVEGRVKASSLRKVGEIVDKHPDEALSILRNWMYQEGSR